MTAQPLSEWFREKLSQEASIDKDAVNLDSDFANFDLDSLSLVSLAYELETFTGLVIDPTVFTEFKTPNDVIQWIQSQKR